MLSPERVIIHGLQCAITETRAEVFSSPLLTVLLYRFKKFKVYRETNHTLIYTLTKNIDYNEKAKSKESKEKRNIYIYIYIYIYKIIKLAALFTKQSFENPCCICWYELDFCAGEKTKVF